MRRQIMKSVGTRIRWERDSVHECIIVSSEVLLKRTRGRPVLDGRAGKVHILYARWIDETHFDFDRISPLVVVLQKFIKELRHRHVL